MKRIDCPDRHQWPQLLARPVMEHEQLEKKVARILAAVKKSGDRAVQRYSRSFDAVSLARPELSREALLAAAAGISPALQQAIEQAAANIRRFHEKQLGAVEYIDTMPGVRCWRKAVPIEKVGLYIPGGSAPLFSTILMLAIPAVLAGCREVVLCTPPGKDGQLPAPVAFAAAITGISRVFRIGGVQAIGAMAYGTETVPAVYKILGPGNQYVTCAKQLVQQQGIAIDMPAGPSEVAIFADTTAIPEFVAADLLSQAEHGPDSQVLLVSTNAGLIDAVEAAIESQLQQLPRSAIARQALANSKSVLVQNPEEAIELLNQYAAEHLILSCENAGQLAEAVVNAGSVFLGNYSPESAGDYASGTNHTLPTNGFARAYSGVSVDSFVKKITYQQLTPAGLEQLGDTIEQLAAAEGLEAHAAAVRIRRKYKA